MPVGKSFVVWDGRRISLRFGNWESAWDDPEYRHKCRSEAGKIGGRVTAEKRRLARLQREAEVG